MKLKELKSFLRVDGDALDTTLKGYQSAAEVYLANAGVKKDYSNALYKIAVSIFVGLLLENPSLAAAGNPGISDITLTSLIAQLRLSQEATT